MEPPRTSNSITAVGVSGETLDPAVMRTQAEDRARRGIARVLSYHVREVVRDWASTRREAFVDEAILETYFESISRGIMNMELQNVQITRWHFSEINNNMYALAELNFDRTLPDVQNLVKKETKKHLQFPDKVDIDAAFKELDEALNKARLNQPSRKSGNF